jgi:tetratricopeptide (TPR) repeat protein
MTNLKSLDGATADIIRQALTAAQSGNITRACTLAEEGLRGGGDSAALNAMLGVLRCRSGDLDQGTEHLRTALALQPHDLTIATNLAAALVEQGQHDAALEVATRDRAEADATLRLARFRAFAAQSAGRHIEAVEAYEHLVARAPDDWEAWNNLGNARAGAGDPEGSVTALRRAVELAPLARPVRLNFATALGRAGDLEQSEQQLRGMAAEFADDTRALRELHTLLKAQLREEEALDAIERAVERDPSDIELLLAMASQRLLLLHTDAAEEAYRKVLALEPGNALANLGLAVVFDLSNRADALSLLVGEAATRGADPGALAFIRAFDHRRAKRFADGLETLERVPEELEAARRVHLRGQLLEGAGRYDEAFRAFSRMNQMSRDDPSRPEERAAAYRAALRAQQDAATPGWAANWREARIGDPRPSRVFLVGFPRSGTTLLDTMLMGHPQIEVLEEEPTTRHAAEVLGDFAALPLATDEQISAARAGYFRTAASLTPLAPGKLLVDKNPLAMNMLPVIHRIFPDARIILALRHPCDVLLSCFITNFKLNDAMSNFIRLDTAADLYDLSFGFFERAQQLFGKPVHRIHYENVVSNREDELRALLDFLSLEWDEDVLDHQATALGRGRIKTASYSQVAEPIYTRATGRWEQYREQLAPVLPILEPWVRKLGYSL